MRSRNSRVVWARNTRNCVLVQLFFPSEPTTNSWSGNACRPKDNGTGRLGGSILSPCEAMFGVLPVPRACAAVLLRRGHLGAPGDTRALSHVTVFFLRIARAFDSDEAARFLRGSLSKNVSTCARVMNAGPGKSEGFYSCVTAHTLELLDGSCHLF